MKDPRVVKLKGDRKFKGSFGVCAIEEVQGAGRKSSKKVWGR